MKGQTAIIFVLLALLLGAPSYLLYRYSSGATKEKRVPPVQTETEFVRAPTDAEQQQVSVSTPPPPPRPPGQPSPLSLSEPERKLVGTTAEQLKRVESALPDGAQVATYPIGETSKAAAIASADLDNDGSIETVVVYSLRGKINSTETSSLYLGVLGSERDLWKLRVSFGGCP